MAIAQPQHARRALPTLRGYHSTARSKRYIVRSLLQGSLAGAVELLLHLMWLRVGLPPSVALQHPLILLSLDSANNCPLITCTWHAVCGCLRAVLPRSIIMRAQQQVLTSTHASSFSVIHTCKFDCP